MSDCIHVSRMFMRGYVCVHRMLTSKRRHTRQSVRSPNGTRLFMKIVADANIVDRVADFGLDLSRMLTSFVPSQALRGALSSHRLKSFVIPGELSDTLR